MSHLIIEQGKEVGREVAVPPTGMKFGRSPANDLVLDDPAAMLFHGRFFFKSDGSLWVTDFGAGEKTTVGGVPIDEYQLKVGDLVEVGKSAFRVVGTSLVGQSPVVAPVAAPQGEIDLGFKPEKKPRAAAPRKEPHKPVSMTSRLLQVAVILLVLIVLMVVGPSLLEISKSDAKAVQQKETLSFSYERVVGSTENIFRYHLELDEKNMFLVKIDDLNGNRHESKNLQITDTIIAQLAHGIEAAGFFDVDSDYAGPSAGQYDLYDITVQRNRKFHRIRVLNRTPPPAIKRTAQAIEDLAISELGISFTWMKTRAELIQLAKVSFELGEARYAEKDVRYGNLASAIAEFKETMLYLETIDSERPLYLKASAACEAAQKEQNARYEDYMFNAEKAIRMRNWTEAAKYLRIASELIQDRSDERYVKISAKLLNIEQYLR